MPGAKIKLTVSELKHKKDELARYDRYLPTLTLKKLQLQVEVNRARAELSRAKKEERAQMAEAANWAAVLAGDFAVADYVGTPEVLTRTVNVAGVRAPVLEEVRFSGNDYDLYDTPAWADRAAEKIRALVSVHAKALLLEEKLAAIQRELDVTVQRVNLFEKVKIPETREQIRKIQVYLADQQTAAVVRGKIAKAKLRKKNP